MLGERTLIFLVQIKTAGGQYFLAVFINEMLQIDGFGKSAQGKIKKLATNRLLHMNGQYILPGLQGRDRRICYIFGLVVSGVPRTVQNLTAVQKYGDVLIVMKGEKE